MLKIILIIIGTFLALGAILNILLWIATKFFLKAGTKMAVEAMEKYKDFPKREITYIVSAASGSTEFTESSIGTSTSTNSRSNGFSPKTKNTVANFSELVQLPLGTLVEIPCVVSQNNSSLIHYFVAYLCEEFKGLKESNSPIWENHSYATPAYLRFELEDGAIIGLNDDYGLTIKVKEEAINNIIQGEPMYQPQENVITWNAMTSTGSKRYCGIAPGDTVTVFAELESTDNPASVRIRHIKLSR